MQLNYQYIIFKFLCCVSLLNAAVNATEYKYDPNSIPHTSTQKLKNIISSGNEAVLVYFCKYTIRLLLLAACMFRLLSKYHDSSNSFHMTGIAHL